MSSEKIARLTEGLKAHLKKAEELADAADASADGQFTDGQRGEVTEHLQKAQAAKDELRKLNADEAVKAAIRDLGDGIGLDENGETPTERVKSAARSGLITPERGKSLGQMFVEGQQYKDLMGGAPNGVFGKDMRVQSRPMGMKSLITGTAQDSAGAFVRPQDLGVQGGIDLFLRPLRLRQLVTNGQTTSDSLEYARVDGWNRGARPVPEAVTADPIGSGDPAVTEAQAGLKPQAGFTTTRRRATVKTIAVGMASTKRALSDASQVRTLIDNFLEADLEMELEDQMVGGDDEGENFEGIEHVSGTLEQPSVADPSGKPAGMGKLLALRRMKTQVRLRGRRVANGYVIHPADLEDIEEISDNDGRFYGAGPFGQVGTTPLIWGLPAIESEAVQEGHPWCGDWGQSVLWDREQASIVVSDSHLDFFMRNLVQFLAEMRAAFGVMQPSAFCRGNL